LLLLYVLVFQHLKNQYVKEILDNGYAYETSKGIYFDTSKLKTYGELSGVDLNNQKAGARIDVDPEKRNPLDFALWIKAPEEHIMKWNSQFGVCYPGWHIECSAMSRKYLGEVFDIHTGGVDHIPIHHENEIAQSKGATGKNPANFWMHVEFLLIDNGKMSKSLGNVYKISELQEKGFEPLSYRYLCFTAHYRNKLNFTWDAISSAQTSLNRLREATNLHKGVNEKADIEKIREFEQKFKEAINDDMNMPVAISIAWEVAKENIKSDEYYKLLQKFDQVLSLDLYKVQNRKDNIDIPENVLEILNRRKEARDNKDFAMSDKLRDELLVLGYVVKDSKEGQKIEEV
jgi:cysteinyl-tRNA synthetase